MERLSFQEKARKYACLFLKAFWANLNVSNCICWHSFVIFSDLATLEWRHREATQRRIPRPGKSSFCETDIKSCAAVTAVHQLDVVERDGRPIIASAAAAADAAAAAAAAATMQVQSVVSYQELGQLATVVIKFPHRRNTGGRGCLASSFTGGGDAAVQVGGESSRQARDSITCG